MAERSAVSNLLSIITTPFYVSAIVVYYYDLRVRKERYDFGAVQFGRQGRVRDLGRFATDRGGQNSGL